MTSVISKIFPKAAVATIILAAAYGMPITASHADSGPFDGYSGPWSGTGTIQIADAGAERIRCKGSANADASGNNLRQSLRCASDSYRFDLSTDLRANGGALSGFWSEASRGINGTVSGKINGGNITALVETNGYVATFNISTKGGKQSIVISSPGPIRGVNISLSH